MGLLRKQATYPSSINARDSTPNFTCLPLRWRSWVAETFFSRGKLRRRAWENIRSSYRVLLKNHKVTIKGKIDDSCKWSSVCNEFDVESVSMEVTLETAVRTWSNFTAAIVFRHDHNLEHSNVTFLGAGDQIFILVRDCESILLQIQFSKTGNFVTLSVEWSFCHRT